MDERPVVTCFLRNDGEILLMRRSDGAGSGRGQWGGVSGPVASDDGSDPETAARAAIDAATGLAHAVTLVRSGEPVRVGERSRVHPLLFDCASRAVEPDEGTAEYEWVHAPELLGRETVPGLWTSYDRVRPRMATLSDRTHGSAWLSLRGLETLRDEAALAGVGGAEQYEEPPDGRAERTGDDWAALADLARRLRAARPSMAVLENRINRVMTAASEERTVGAVERALRGADPEAVLVAESRPGGEGVGVAESLADVAAVTLTTDAALAVELREWDADAVLVGADRVLPDGSVVNKVGTRGAALAATHAGIDCLVVAASDKVAAGGGYDPEPREPGELYDGGADLEVANPTFDVTPADAVTAVVTEQGRLSTAEVGSVAAAHREWEAWER